ARQNHGPVANADEPADSMPHRFEHAADFTVATFGDGDAVPAVGAFAPSVLDGTEGGHSIIQAYTIQKLLLFFIAQGAQHAHRVLPLQPKAGVHQLVGQLARTGKQQQPFRVQVQTPDRLPLTLREPRQLAKYRGAVLWVVVGYHLTNRLVVSDDPCRRRVNPVANGFAIDLDLIAELDALADMGRLIVHRNAPLQNEL